MIWFEQIREWLAFKIYPELNFYLKLSGRIGSIQENERLVNIIEQSSLKNKKAVIDLIEIKYTELHNLIEKLNDASEDRTS
jgi:Fe-S-cluster formation regulator IscX/YfhJ